MQRLHYSDGSMITSDGIAHAVMHYAKVLADHAQSDVVTIPIIDDDDARREATLLIGPASQLHTTPITQPLPEIDAADVESDLRDRADRLEHPPMIAPDPEAGRRPQGPWDSVI